MAYINIKFQTDQTGANSNVCSGASIVFNFSLTDTYNLTTADISLKKGSGTTQSITASVYNQANGGGSVVASATVLAANITQSYSSIIFDFNNVLLSAGTSYSLVLSSTTSCSGSSPYSMKSGNFQVLNSDTNTILNTGYGISANILSDSTASASANVIPPSPTPTNTATNTPTNTPTNTSTNTPTNTPTNQNITPTPTPTIPINKIRRNANAVKLRLGSKAPKMYRGNSLIYNPNNN